MKFQDSSFNGLKVTVGTESVMHLRTHALTDAPKAICPINFFKVRGINKTWPLTKPDLQHLQRNDRAIIRQICNVKPEDMATVRSNKLLARLEIDDLDVILREKSLRWFGHIGRSSGAIKTVCNMQIEGKHGPGKPKITWRTLKETEHHEWKLNEVDPCDRDVQRSNVRSAMLAASQLLGGDPLMSMMLLHLHINLNDDDDDLEFYGTAFQ